MRHTRTSLFHMTKIYSWSYRTILFNHGYAKPYFTVNNDRTESFYVSMVVPNHLYLWWLCQIISFINGRTEPLSSIMVVPHHTSSSTMIVPNHFMYQWSYRTIKYFQWLCQIISLISKGRTEPFHSTIVVQRHWTLTELSHYIRQYVVIPCL